MSETKPWVAKATESNAQHNYAREDFRPSKIEETVLQVLESLRFLRDLAPENDVIATRKGSTGESRLGADDGSRRGTSTSRRNRHPLHS